MKYGLSLIDTFVYLKRYSGIFPAFSDFFSPSLRATIHPNRTSNAWTTTMPILSTSSLIQTSPSAMPSQILISRPFERSKSHVSVCQDKFNSGCESNLTSDIKLLMLKNDHAQSKGGHSVHSASCAHVVFSANQKLYRMRQGRHSRLIE